ncbi:MAG: hypothetical protein ACRD0K_14450 [Egibacteraceae bacterium]
MIPDSDTVQEAIWGRLVSALLAAVIFVAPAACTAEGVADQLPLLRRIECPASPPVDFAALDLSATGRAQALFDERLQMIRALLTRTAVCGGQARVVGFSSSQAATHLLYDGELRPEGATENARLRRVPKLVEAAMAVIEAELEEALATLPANGTDVLSQLRLATEFHALVDPDRPLRVLVLSDGLQTVGIVLDRPDLTVESAHTLASAARLPEGLAGAQVMFGGIGKVSGPPAPTAFVEGLKTFYQEACEQAEARCLVATDLTPEVIP